MDFVSIYALFSLLCTLATKQIERKNASLCREYCLRRKPPVVGWWFEAILVGPIYLFLHCREYKSNLCKLKQFEEKRLRFEEFIKKGEY